MKQPTTQVNVRINAMMTYHKWPLHLQMMRQGSARVAFRRAGLALNKKPTNIDTITSAWHEQKTRLRRNLTKTELEDILGWAA